MLLSNIEKNRSTWNFKPSKGSLIVVSGPSGVGKGTIVRELIKLEPDKLELSVSVTTRKPRPHEINGKDYFFRSGQAY